MATARDRHPQAFTVGEQDPRKRARKVAMEAFSFGYPRTGTMTMQAALETLGYPTWHFVEMTANFPDIDMWNEALLAHYDPALAAKRGIKPFGRKEHDSLLSDWSATTDIPAALLCEDLMATYREAKVILVERDAESWYRSYESTIIKSSESWVIPILRLIDPAFMRRSCAQADIVMKYEFGIDVPWQRWPCLWKNPEALRQYRAKARGAYLSHNEMVKRVVQKERLLVMRLEEGWEPLCRFLGRAVPEGLPFPRVNETEKQNERIGVYVGEACKRALRSLGRRVLVVLGVVAAVGWAWSVRR